MHAVVLSMMLVGNPCADRCCCLKVMALFCEPRPHRCCPPYYLGSCKGCPPGAPGCGVGAAYNYRADFDYPWSDPRMAFRRPPLRPSWSPVAPAAHTGGSLVIPLDDGEVLLEEVPAAELTPEPFNSSRLQQPARQPAVRSSANAAAHRMPRR